MKEHLKRAYKIEDCYAKYQASYSRATKLSRERERVFLKEKGYCFNTKKSFRVNIFNQERGIQHDMPKLRRLPQVRWGITIAYMSNQGIHGKGLSLHPEP